VITKVTASSYSNGASTGFTTTTTTSNVNTQQAVNTNLNGDKIGIAGNDIITHRTTTFNPNVKIVINKKSSPGLLKPNGSTSIATPSEPSEVLEVVQDEEESNSTTFILIAGVIIVLIFVALYVAKTVLAKKVVVAHQRAAELQAAKVKSFQTE